MWGSGLVEGLSMMLLKYLRVPPGTSLRKSDGSKVGGNIEDNDYISTIVDITVDDICIGNSPLSVKYSDTLGDGVVDVIENTVSSFNKILRWVAKDLCLRGYSVYKAEVSEKSGKLLLFPYLDDVEFYMDRDGEVVVYDKTNESKFNLDSMVVFLNFDKSSLCKVDDSEDNSLIYRITPCAMQLRNADKTARFITLAENSLMRYRTQLSRIARFVTVDIGASQGDKQDEVVDGISSSINADSMSLSFDDSACEYDDSIPVIPHRKGIGRPELTTDIPNYNLSELGDLDYLLNKITLMMRFPATYMDFTKTMDASVATTLRGDLRYARMCESVRSKIEDTINELFSKSEKFGNLGLTFVMNRAPSTEDSDMVDTLGNFVDITNSFYSYVMGEGGEDDTLAMKRGRLHLIQTIFTGSCSSKAISDWFDEMNKILSDNIGNA